MVFGNGLNMHIGFSTWLLSNNYHSYFNGTDDGVS